MILDGDTLVVFNAPIAVRKLGITGAGAQGPQGFQGTQGGQGPQGFQGVAGLGSQGAQGDQGFQGDQGSTGSLGPQGDQGDQGLTGSQGPQGFQGFQGATGSTGAQGNQGNQGSQGFQGTQGTTGSTGAQGNQGDQGFQGTTGSTGAQGTQGFQGTQGTTGSTGSQGNQGNQGSQGFQGTQGTAGSQGNQGFQGTQGTVGAIGPGINLVPNPSFEDPLTPLPWVFANANTTVDTGTVYLGGKSIKLITSGASGADAVVIVPIDETVLYSCSLYYDITAFTSGTVYVEIVFYSSLVGTGFLGIDYLLQATATSSGWTRVSKSYGPAGSGATVTIPAGTKSIRIHPIINFPDVATVYFDAFQFCPSPVGTTPVFSQGVGSQGNQGNQGFQGTQGNQGNQGFQGTQGTAGSNGAQGTQGNQGNQGDQGAQGSQGSQGNQGNQGNVFYYGAQGGQQAITSTTLVNIGGLVVALPGAGTYAFDACIPCNAQTGTNGAQFGAQFSGTTTSLECVCAGNQSGSMLVTRITAKNTAGGVVCNVSTAEWMVRITGLVIVTSSGNFSIQALKVTSQTLFIRPGAFVDLFKIA